MSGRIRSRPVIAPVSENGTLYFREKSEKHFVTAIGAITASGSALEPAILIKRQNAQPDMLQMPFWGRHRVYSSPKAFVSKKIFGDYLRTVVLPYVESVRRGGSADELPAVLIMDGHKSHLLRKLEEILAERNIKLIFIPPHSSHILQPLDQVFFKNVKRQFSLRRKIIPVSEISSTLQRISSAYQAASVDWDIIQSWAHTGVVPMRDTGGPWRIELDLRKILESGEVEPGEINERAREKKLNGDLWGLLNSEQLKVKAAGRCPLCFSQLPQVRLSWGEE